MSSIYKNFTAHHLSKFVQNWSKMILLEGQLARVAQRICLIFSSLSTIWQTKKKKKTNNIIWPKILLKKKNVKLRNQHHTTTSTNFSKSESRMIQIAIDKLVIKTKACLSTSTSMFLELFHKECPQTALEYYKHR